jgi:hypothetical protein
MASVAAMVRASSSLARPGGSLSRQNSGIRALASPGPAQGKKPGSPNLPGRKVSAGAGGASSKEASLEGGKPEGRVDIGGFNPQPFKLETSAACQLITCIYESKVREYHIMPTF